VRVVWGKADAVLPVSNSHDLPVGAELRVVDGAGHMVHLEKPAAVVEAVAAATGG
jgi:pyruvate dehydrogenase E2 component (dihydrolipoamide acetyltransferase)